jgi:hypothetical protein
MTTFNKSISILIGPSIYLDHLGVLSEILQIPLIVTEEKTFLIAKKFYPNLEVKLVDLSEITLEFLASNFDTIFHTNKFWVVEIDPILKLIHKKTMRFVFCPHGNSDKESYFTNHVKQDVSLFYGEQMLRQLHHSGSLKKIGFTVETGNYRYDYFKKNEIFFKLLLEEELSNKLDPAKKTIFYAPSWDMKNTPSSFFEHFESIIATLNESFNLIIKIHPLLEERYPAETFFRLSKLQQKRNVVLLSDFPAVYPILSISDIYLGDYSSIGYDFLSKNKPMFFLLPEGTKKGDLCQCGMVLPSDKSICLKSFIENNTIACMNDFYEKRIQLYNLSFGDKFDQDSLKANLKKVLNL